MMLLLQSKLLLKFAVCNVIAVALPYDVVVTVAFVRAVAVAVAVVVVIILVVVVAVVVDDQILETVR